MATFTECPSRLTNQCWQPTQARPVPPYWPSLHCLMAGTMDERPASPRRRRRSSGSKRVCHFEQRIRWGQMHLPDNRAVRLVTGNLKSSSQHVRFRDRRVPGSVVGVHSTVNRETPTHREARILQPALKTGRRVEVRPPEPRSIDTGTVLFCKGSIQVIKGWHKLQLRVDSLFRPVDVTRVCRCEGLLTDS